MLGVMVTPGTNLKWFDVVLAPLTTPYMLGRLVAVFLVKNVDIANGTKPADKKLEKTSE